MKQVLDLVVKEKKWLNARNVLLKVTQKAALPEMFPGQFVEVRIDNSATTFLRRPISVHFYNKEANELWILIQLVGDGTRKLAELEVGSLVNIMLPLGNSFAVPKVDEKVLLVGGGVGVAPLLYQGAALKKLGIEVHFLLGARTQDDLLQLEEFSKFGTLHTTTEDGSMGEQGFVTQHSVWNAVNFDLIQSCGPTPMMKAVAKLAKEKNIACEVSLENTMACGIGACLCCVTDTQKGHQCVCTDGPVFKIEDLKWEI